MGIWKHSTDKNTYDTLRWLVLFLAKYRNKRRVSMSKIRFMSFLICMSLMVGCATNWPKQFDKKLALLDRKGLVLTRLTFDNKLNKSDALLPLTFLIGKNGKDSYEKYRLNSRHLRATTESRGYLIVMDVDNGNYFFYSVLGRAMGLFFQPLFEAPMLVSFQVKENEILYIGNIHLVLRNKASDSELAAGPVIPLLDQATIAGATFDVEINDEYERDMNEFEKVFPNLKGHSVVKRILPPWKRPSSQEFEPKKIFPFFF